MAEDYHDFGWLAGVCPGVGARAAGGINRPAMFLAMMQGSKLQETGLGGGGPASVSGPLSGCWHLGKE